MRAVVLFATLVATIATRTDFRMVSIGVLCGLASWRPSARPSFTEAQRSNVRMHHNGMSSLQGHSFNG